MHVTRLRWPWMLAAILLATPLFAEERKVLFDFERPGLASEWTASGKIEASRQPVPSVSEVEGGPRGHGLAISTQGPGGMFAKSGTLPSDWRRYRELSLWVFRSPEESRRSKSTTMHVELIEADGKARFARRVDLDHQGWKQFELPLPWFRWGEGRVPRWDRIDRLGLIVRDPAALSIDQVALVPGTTADSAELSLDALREVAFPEQAASQILQVKSATVALMTDAKELNGQQLAEHLLKVAEAVQHDLPFLPKSSAPTPLIVFATPQAYQSFPPRFAEKLGAEAQMPKSSGFTLLGIATSSWDARFGTLRPVYTHEFVHAFLTPQLRVQNKSEWFHEGLANLYQLRFHPQDNIAQIVKTGIDDENQRLPLETLCNGQPVPLARYWQAFTLVEMLLTRPKFKERLPALVAAFQSSGSTELGPHLQPVLQSSWTELTAAWQSHCRDTYK